MLTGVVDTGIITGVVVTSNHCSPGVVDTDDKFITGINDTDDHRKSVSKINRGAVDTGDKFVSGVVGTAEQFIVGVVDTADQHSFAIISANFQKRRNNPKGYSGPGENLVSDSLKTDGIGHVTARGKACRNSGHGTTRRRLTASLHFTKIK